jgi:predicted HicB family RNase H-like nuclease
MSELKQVSTYLNKEEKKALVNQAEKENRSLSNLVASILKDYLKKLKK